MKVWSRKICIDL